METPDPHVPAPTRLSDLAAMAALLERIERQPGVTSPAQYREVARRIEALLAGAEPGPALDALLAIAPATSLLYENLHYAHAGLCRSSLEAALGAEVAAAQAIERARRR
jgi:hypothetical protein